MIKSHVLALNTLVQINIPIKQLTNESKIHLKCGRPVSSNDVISQKKRRTQGKLSTLEETIKIIDQSKFDECIAFKEAQIKHMTLEEAYIDQEGPKEV